MPRPIHVNPHLTREQLLRRWRATSESVERCHLQMIWLALDQHSAAEIARVTGIDRSWVFKIIQRYNAEGPDALGDKRKEARRGNRKLSTTDEAALEKALNWEPEDGGIWTAPKVVAWLRRCRGKQISEATAKRTLHRLGFSRQVPRPRHTGADAKAQSSFKKKRSQPKSGGFVVASLRPA
jgi:transposase